MAASPAGGAESYPSTPEPSSSVQVESLENSACFSSEPSAFVRREDVLYEAETFEVEARPLSESPALSEEPHLSSFSSRTGTPVLVSGDEDGVGFSQEQKDNSSVLDIIPTLIEPAPQPPINGDMWEGARSRSDEAGSPSSFPLPHGSFPGPEGIPERFGSVFSIEEAKGELEALQQEMRMIKMIEFVVRKERVAHRKRFPELYEDSSDEEALAGIKNAIASSKKKKRKKSVQDGEPQASGSLEDLLGPS